MKKCLKFKNEAIKNKYLNGTSINRLSEFYKCEKNIENMLIESNLEINKLEDLAFVKINSWEDLIVEAEINGFEYAFCIYFPENNTLQIQSYLGNIKIIDDKLDIRFPQTGIFKKCKNFEDSKNIFLNMMKKNYHYFDIVYYEGKFFN